MSACSLRRPGVSYASSCEAREHRGRYRPLRGVEGDVEVADQRVRLLQRAVVAVNWVVIFGAAAGFVLGTSMPVVFERAHRLVFLCVMVVVFGAAGVAASSLSADWVIGFVVGAAVGLPAVARHLLTRRRSTT